MATKKKMLQAAAGQAGGAGLDITDVFSTYLYTGNGSTQTITNDIDLAGEGGLVWIKSRSAASDHSLVDTARGVGARISTNSTSAQDTYSGYLSAFNSNGFDIGYTVGTNNNGDNYASWTFRKAPKFFDCVTWSGDGVAGREISHNLGTTVGSIFIKQTTGTNNWIVYHRGVNGGVNPEQYNLYLNLTNAQEDFILFNDTAPTDTNFTVGGYAAVNGAGQTYVAYLFAHNDGDGEFGPNADQDIIKCGDFTTDSSGNASVSLGFEPQWLLVKKTDGGAPWYLFDVMRGIPTGGLEARLEANATGAEVAGNNYIDLTADGFEALDLGGTKNHIYIAIRRGPLAPPESGTEVFAVHKETTSNLNQTPPFLQPAPFAVDFISNKLFGGLSSWWSATRLTNARLQFESTAAETSVSTTHEFDHNDGVAVNGLTGDTNFMGYMWKRAPGFFDVVAYKGNGSNPHSISHNLGVAPQLIWIKSRDVARTWTSSIPTGSGISTTGRLILNSTTGATTQAYFPSQPTDTDFTIISDPDINANGENYIAYLFATLPGISKVGSYTGTGQTGGDINVDCGFTSGARFVMIKRTDASGSWWVADTARGIVSGNEPLLALNDTSAELTGYNMVEPYSSGFIVNGSGGGDNSWNDAGGNYIFYAIA